MSFRAGALVAFLGAFPFAGAWALTPFDVNVIHFVCGCVILGWYWGQVAAGLVKFP